MAFAIPRPPRHLRPSPTSPLCPPTHCRRRSRHHPPLAVSALDPHADDSHRPPGSAAAAAFRHSRASLANSMRLFFQTAVASPASPELDRDIFSIAVPALATMAIDPLMSMVDTAFVGQLGVAQLGAVGAASLIFKFSFSLFNFLAKTTTPLVALALVRSDPARASRTIAQNLQVALTLGTLIAILLHLSAPSLSAALLGPSKLSSSHAMVSHAVTYIRCRAFAAPAVFATYVASGAFRGFKDTRTPLYVALAANVANLVLDAGLMFGCGMGVAGAALATGVAQVVTGVGLVGVMVGRGMVRGRDLGRWPEREMVGEIVASALFSVRTVSIMTAHSVAGTIAARLGAVASAAYAIGRQLWSFQAIALDSFEVAAQSLVAEALGRDDTAEARTVAIRLLQLGVLAGAVLGLATCLLAPSLVSLFTSDEAVRRIAIRTIPLFSAFQPISAAVFIYDGIFAAARDYAHTAKAVLAAGVASTGWLLLTRRWWGGAAAGQVVLPGLVMVWMGMNVLTAARAILLGARFLSPRGPIPPFDRTRRPKRNSGDTFLVRAQES